MSTQPFTAGRFRASDANGAPLVGGLLYTYAAGTTTPQATYNSADRSNPNSNPVVLDSRGEADVWLLPGVDYHLVLFTSALSLQWDVDNFPSPAEQSASTDVAANDPGGRLTLDAALPVTDTTGATTVRYLPYKHDKVPLYDGTTWALFSIGAGLSQALGDNTKSPAAVVASSNYDLFIWNDAGTVRVSRGPPWVGDASRGTGIGTTQLVQVNGRYVNANAITNGPAAHLGLYVGTIRTDASLQANDIPAKRHVWNNHNRVRRKMMVVDATATWNYSTASLRQANGNGANQLDFVLGLSEDAVSARLAARVINSTSTPRAAYVAIGLDGTAMSASCLTEAKQVDTTAAALWASYMDQPTAGRHTLVWLEQGAGADTQTWSGAIFVVPAQAGLHGEMLA